MLKSSHSGLFQSVSRISLLTFISRCLGMLRDLSLAQYFGASAAVDAYYLAARIPNLCRNLLAEGALTQALVPVLSDLTAAHSKHALRQFIRDFSGMILLLLGGLCALGICFAPTLIHLFAPGYEGVQFELATQILRISFPFVVFIFLVAFVAAILNIHGRYVWPVVGSSVLNIVLIISVVIAKPYFTTPILSQAYGLVLGAALVLAIELIALRGLGLLVCPRICFNNPTVKRVLSMMGPAVIGASFGQLSILINSMYVSNLPAGSVAWLYYAERLAYFPIGVLGVALSTVLLPTLSKLHARHGRREFIEMLNWGLKWNFMLGLFSSVMLYFLAEPLVICVYAYAAFGLQDVLKTAAALQAYALGLVAFMLTKTLLSAFHAQKDLVTPVKLAALSILISVLVSGLLLQRYQHVALAFATSCSSWLYVLMLFVILQQRGIYCLSAKTAYWALLSGLACVAFIGFCSILSPSPLIWLSWGVYDRWMHLLCLAFVGFAMLAIIVKVLSLPWFSHGYLMIGKQHEF